MAGHSQPRHTLRDAIGQAVGTLVDAFAKTGGADVTKKGSPQLAESLTSAAKHAYDPMLEKHIGRPVVLRLQNPEREEPFEMPGYLVDYSDDWLAVFNVEHEHLREEVVTATDSIERGDLVVDLDDRHARISNPGREFLVVRAVRIGGVPHDLAVGLLPGCSLELPRGANDAVELELS